MTVIVPLSKISTKISENLALFKQLGIDTRRTYTWRPMVDSIEITQGE